MSYTYDDMSPREFRHSWTADAAARVSRRDPLAAADRETGRILAMSDTELQVHVENQGLTVEGEAAKARAAFQRAERAVRTGRRGLCLVLVGPSGSGKTSIANGLVGEDYRIRHSVSVTTRPMRCGEFDGADYDFIAQAAFQELQATGGLLEHTEYAGHCYGTRRYETEVLLKHGTDLVFVLDVAGAIALQAAMPGDVVSVYIKPPSTGVLWDRLLARGETPESIDKRWAVDSAQWTAGQWACEHSVTNENLDTAVRKVRSILRRARAARMDPADRRAGLDALVEMTEEYGL